MANEFATTNHKLADLLAKKRRMFEGQGGEFDTSKLDRRFAEFYGTGQRIKVEEFGEVKFGTVGITTGWQPVFLLVRDSRAVGSSVVLDENVRLVAVRRGKTYKACYEVVYPSSMKGER